MAPPKKVAAPAKPNPELKDLRSRRAYITVRRPEIRTELKNLVAERQKMVAEAKAGNLPKGPERKSRLARVSYVKHRMAILKEEEKTLKLENATLSEKMKKHAAE